MNRPADMPVVVSEETLRRIIREELGRGLMRPSESLSVYVPDRTQFRPALFLSSLLYDIAEVARAAGIKEGSPGSRSRTPFAITWLLMNLMLLGFAWMGPGPMVSLAVAVFGMTALNVWCLIVYHSLQPDSR